MEKAKLDREIDRWDDSGNDIIVISKQMCMIMMEMTDFTRSVGVVLRCQQGVARMFHPLREKHSK